MINGYGPTECTTFSICCRLTAADAAGATVPIGRPVSSAQAYVLGADLELLPIGAAGELCIGGDGLARGYFNNPVLTAERFVENPFGPPGSRLYRTGDLVRYRPNGVLEFLGRLDRQIKIRGYRIVPAEIETALLSYPAVRQALVVARPDGAGDKRLIAYLVGDSGAVPEADELLADLRTHLPAYMAPAAIVMLDALPLTPNGKVDQEALPPPQWLPARRRRAGAPRTPIEKTVAEIWSSVLNLDDLRVTDDFFERGGSAAGFAEALARLGRRFGVVLDPAADGVRPTIASLVNHLKRKLANGANLENA